MSIKHSYGVVKNILIKDGDIIFLADFIVLNIEKDQEILIILGRQFITTGLALMNFENSKIILRVKKKRKKKRQQQQQSFSMNIALRQQPYVEERKGIDNEVNENYQSHHHKKELVDWLEQLGTIVETL